MTLLPRLSIMLLTTGKQPLIEFSIRSLLPQVETEDEFVISINSTDSSAISWVRELIQKLDPEGLIRVIQTGSQCSVYEHYRFVIDHSLNDHLLIAHDDEIYNSTILQEFRTGFSNPSVTVVVGGLLMVEPSAGKLRISQENSFTESKIRNGLEWIKETEGLYPRFCFSSLALNKKVLKLNIFSATATSADCLAVTQQAIAGSVYHSKKIFATWLQLPTRNSRWYLIKPGLTAPWKEYLDFYQTTGDQELIERGEKAKMASVKSFIWLLFVVAVSKRSPILIDSCLAKITEIDPTKAAILSPIRWPIVYYPLSFALSLAAFAKTIHIRFIPRAGDQQPEAALILGVDPQLWSLYATAVLKL